MSNNTTPSVQKAPTRPAYIAGSAEKKKAVMMYVGLGIVLSLSRDTMSPFEYFHFKQSLGWWMLFMIIVLVAIVVMFLPIIWFIGWLLIVCMLGLVFFFAKQAWDGIYFDRLDIATLPLFIGMGGWILQMFDIQIHIPGDDEVQPQ